MKKTNNWNQMELNNASIQVLICLLQLFRNEPLTQYNFWHTLQFERLNKIKFDPHWQPPKKLTSYYF